MAQIRGLVEDPNTGKLPNSKLPANAATTTALDGKLTKPANPSVTAVVTVTSSGTTGTTPVSDLAGVSTVNGKTGSSVTLAAADVGAAPANVTPRFASGKLYQPDGTTEIVLGTSGPATPAQLLTVNTGRALAAGDLANMLNLTFSADGTMLVPSSTALSTTAWPLGGQARLIRNGAGIVTIAPDTGGTLSTPAVRAVAEFTRDYDNTGGGINYVVPYPTTAAGDIVLCFISRADPYANWAFATGWTLITTPEGGKTAGAPDNSACYVFARAGVTGNLAGTSATFTAQSSDGRPAAALMVSVSGASTGSPIAAYAQSGAGTTDAAVSPAVTAPGVGNNLEITAMFSSDSDQDPYGAAPSGTTSLGSLVAGTALGGNRVRLGVQRGNTLVGASQTAGPRTRTPGGYGGGVSLLVRPTGSGPTLLPAGGPRRLVLPGADAVVTRFAADVWHLSGDLDF